MKKRKRNLFFNRTAEGSVGMSFSTIFSIILIIFFIIAAFIAIKAFFDYKKCVQVGMFLKNIQPEIDRVWNSEGFDSESVFNLPSNLKYVCFANLSENFKGDSIMEEVYQEIRVYEGENTNLFLYPVGSSCNLPDNKVEHLNFAEITKNENPRCFQIKNGVVKIRMQKEIGENLVKII